MAISDVHGSILSNWDAEEHCVSAKAVKSWLKGLQTSLDGVDCLFLIDTGQLCLELHGSRVQSWIRTIFFICCCCCCCLFCPQRPAIESILRDLGGSQATRLYRQQKVQIILQLGHQDWVSSSRLPGTKPNVFKIEVVCSLGVLL